MERILNRARHGDNPTLSDGGHNFGVTGLLEIGT